jgi:hypothetical protein
LNYKNKKISKNKMKWILDKIVYILVIVVSFLSYTYGLDNNASSCGLGMNSQKEIAQINDTLAFIRLASSNIDSYINLLDYIKTNFPEDQSNEIISLLMKLIANATSRNNEICIPENIFQESITELSNILQ